MAECLTLGDFERYSRGGLEPAAEERIRRHLESCPRCQAAYHVFQTDNQFVGRVRDNLAAPTPGDGTEPQSPTLSAATPASDSGARGPTWQERFPEIEGYEIRRIIGRGGMGVVYEAVQEKLNRPVALKLLPAVVSTAHPEFVTRFRREATAAARLHHTNVIPIYDFGESRDGYYYAMELVNGQPLSTVIRRLAGMDVHLASTTSIAALLTGPEPAPTAMTPGGTELEPPPTGSGSSSTGTKGRVYYRQVAHWMADVADALHYAHLQGLIHRDIKPGNLMVCTDGRIMILDFGLVKTVGERSVTATGSLVGTYRYMSPEQVGAKRIRVDARSDVYSLGATMYELLTCCPAFPSTEQSELLSQILFKEPTPPRQLVPSVPVDLQTICLKALEKSPGARYQTAQAMADDLNSYLRDLAIRARPQGPLRRAVKFVRRHQVAAIAVSAMLICLLLGTAGLLHYRRMEHDRAQAEQGRVAAEQQQREKTIVGLLARAGAHRERNDVDAAFATYQEILRLAPAEPRALINLANIYSDRYQEGHEHADFERAMALLDQALAQRPKPKLQLDAWNTRGVLQKDAGHLEEAVIAYRKAIEVDGTRHEPWTNLGALRAEQGDLAAAEDSLRQAVALAQNDIHNTEPQNRATLLRWQLMPFRYLAAVLIAVGKPEAKAVLDQAGEYDHGTDPALLALRARYYGSLGRPADDAQAFKLVSAIEVRAPQEPTLGRAMACAKRVKALVAIRRQDWKEAQTAAREAAAGDVPAFAHLLSAIALAHLGEQAAGEAELQAGVSAWPGQLREASCLVNEDSTLLALWIDTRAELQALHDLATEALAQPQTLPPEPAKTPSDERAARP